MKYKYNIYVYIKRSWEEGISTPKPPSGYVTVVVDDGRTECAANVPVDVTT